LGAPLKLTDERIRMARQIVEKRREAERLMNMYPTIEQLAWQLDVTPRYLRKVLNGKARTR
jgi:hypothetical protein